MSGGLTTPSVRLSIVSTGSVHTGIEEYAFAAAKRRVSRQVPRTQAIEFGDTEVCQVTGLTGRQMKLLMTSWTKMTALEGDSLRKLGQKMLFWSFQNIPKMRSYFEDIKGNTFEEMRRQETFIKRANLFVGAFHDLITHIDDHKKLSNTFQYIALIHLKQDPPVKSSFFRTFRNKFRFFLESRFDPKADKATIEAWGVLLEAMYRIYREDEGQQNAQESKCCCSIC